MGNSVNAFLHRVSLMMIITSTKAILTKQEELLKSGVVLSKPKLSVRAVTASVRCYCLALGLKQPQLFAILRRRNSNIKGVVVVDKTFLF